METNTLARCIIGKYFLPFFGLTNWRSKIVTVCRGHDNIHRKARRCYLHCIFQYICTFLILNNKNSNYYIFLFYVVHIYCKCENTQNIHRISAPRCKAQITLFISIRQHDVHINRFYNFEKIIKLQYLSMIWGNECKYNYRIDSYPIIKNARYRYIC